MGANKLTAGKPLLSFTITRLRVLLLGVWAAVWDCVEEARRSVGEVRLRLFLDSEAELKYQTQVMVLPQVVTRGAQWLELCKPRALFLKQPHIPGRTPAVVLGVMEEPPFKKSSVITLSGSMLYNYCETPDDNFQDVLDHIRFKVEDLIQGSLKPFSSSQTGFDESDLLSVVVTSSHWGLHVSTRHGLPAKLQLNESGLTLDTSLGCWVGRADGSLAGLLVIQREISSASHELELYAKDVKQALQFVHSLGSQWRVEKVGDSSVSEKDCVRTLGEELRFLLTTMQPGTEFTAEEWAKVRTQLNKLELATDSTFAQYSLH